MSWEFCHLSFVVVAAAAAFVSSPVVCLGTCSSLRLAHSIECTVSSSPLSSARIWQEWKKLWCHGQFVVVVVVVIVVVVVRSQLQVLVLDAVVAVVSDMCLLPNTEFRMHVRVRVRECILYLNWCITCVCDSCFLLVGLWTGCFVNRILENAVGEGEKMSSFLCAPSAGQLRLPLSIKKKWHFIYSFICFFIYLLVYLSLILHFRKYLFIYICIIFMLILNILSIK